MTKSSIRTRVSKDYFPMRDERAGGTIYIWTLGDGKTPHVVAREFGHIDHDHPGRLQQRCPAQAFHRQFDLAHPRSGTDIELRQRGATDDAICLQRMTQLKRFDAID